MLPCLNTAEKLMAKAHANHRGPSTVIMNITGDDRDTVEYLAQLGVEAVEFLRSDDSTEPPPDLRSAVNPAGTTIHASFVASGTDLTASSLIPWKLVAMRLEPPQGTIAAFTTALKASTGLDPDDPTKHHELLTQYRPELSAAMTVAASEVGFAGYGNSLTNWSCISIFGSSPTPVTSHSAPVGTAGDFSMDCDHGWLHTGDLPPDITDVWQTFKRVWEPHLGSASLCALTALHHGSPNGHNPSLYATFEAPQVFCRSYAGCDSRLRVA